MAQPVLSIDTKLWRQEMGSRCSRTETTSEEALVRASRRGNQQAIETLFRRYQRQLLGAARRILGNTEDAEDALQDGLLTYTLYLHHSEARDGCENILAGHRR